MAFNKWKFIVRIKTQRGADLPTKTSLMERVKAVSDFDGLSSCLCHSTAAVATVYLKGFETCRLV
jgi:hypothetical protein